MGIEITVKNLGDPEIEQELKSKIKGLLNEREGDWQVSVLGRLSNTVWEVRVKAPEGLRWLEKYEGLGGHSIDSIIIDIASVV